MSYGFCSKYYTLSSSAKKCKHRLRFDKVIESIKVGTFLRHSVEQKSEMLPAQRPLARVRPRIVETVYDKIQFANVVDRYKYALSNAI